MELRAFDQERLELVETIIEAMAQPVILLMQDTGVLVSNAKARQLLPALKNGEPLHMGVRAPDILDAVRAVVAGGAAKSVFWHQRVPVELIFEVYVAPLATLPIQPKNSGKAFKYVLVSMRDLTHAHLVERMRVDFIANASHELRTPLASLLGFIETLQGAAKEDAKARDNFLAIMREQAQRMARLVDDLLSLSSIEQRQNVRPEEPIDLSLIAAHVADTLGLLARENGMALVLDLADEALVAGARDELVRLVENLVENAIKYGRPAHQATAHAARKNVGQADIGQADIGQVDIGVMKDGQFVYLSVRDHGSGIAQEHLPRLTERFYRIDTDQSRSKGGTGLGLAIVKHIVARHRGRLSIESRTGHGTVFSVQFPAFSDT